MTPTSSHTPYSLSLINLWQQQFAPVTSLLADISYLPIPQVKQSLPHLFKIAILQINNRLDLSQHPHFINQLTDGTLTSPPLETGYTGISQAGMGFTQVPSLQPLLFSVRERMFDDTLHYHRLLGLLSDRTAIDLVKLQTLLDWTMLLCLISLYQISTTLPLSTSQLVNWLTIQPFLGFERNDEGLLSLYHQRFLKQLPSVVEDKVLNQKSFITPISTTPKILNLFSLCPTTAFANSLVATSSIQPNVITPSIFTPTTSPTPLLAFFQKYWIATGVVLTTAIFGMMSLVLTTPSETKPTALTPAEKPIHDVAILKIDSSPVITAPSSQKNTSTNKTSAVKMTEKTPNPSSNKANHPPSPDKKSKPDPKIQTSSQKPSKAATPTPSKRNPEHSKGNTMSHNAN